MTIKNFIENFKNANVQNTKINPDAIGEWIRKNLEIKSYIPFNEKRKVAEMVVTQNISIIDGIKKYDSINGYVSLIVASIMAHTNLTFSKDPIADYDLLADSGLLLGIIAEFESSHKEIDILMHMALDMEMEDNNVNVLVGRFLNKFSGTLNGVLEATKDKIRDLDFANIFGEDIKREDFVQLMGVLNKLK